MELKVAEFLALLNKMLAEHNEKSTPTLKPKVVSLDKPGAKYTRVVVASHAHDRGVYCFLDNTNGDILKADGWKRPAKHPRGNINNPNPIGGCGPYGVAYLR